jgi:hypothetical protein
MDRDEMESDILRLECLHGRVFASLDSSELELFMRFRRIGRQHKVCVKLGYDERYDEGKESEFWSLIEVASSQQEKDIIHMRYGSIVRVYELL